jgi:hypothetical protein
MYLGHLPIMSALTKRLPDTIIPSEISVKQLTLLGIFFAIAIK